MKPKSINIFLDIDERFKAKAEYVFRTFCSLLGLEPNFIDDEQQAFHVYYGFDTQKEFLCHPLCIFHEPQAVDFYEKKELYPLENIIFEEYDSQNLPFLFSLPASQGVKKEGYSLEYLSTKDIISSTFYFLSCWQEYVVEDSITPENRYDFKQSIQYKLNIAEIPVVDYYCNIFKHCLRENNFPFSSDDNPRSSVLSISHDIDYFDFWTKEHLYSIYKYNIKRLFFDPFRAIYKLGGHFITKQFFYRADKELKKILSKEEKLNVTSTSFLLTKSDNEDKRQEYFENKAILAQLKDIYKGKSVGLHGSMKASIDEDLLYEQKNIFQSADFEIKGYRNHYLCINYQKSFALLEKAGFIYDATLGFWEHIGYRAGISKPFFPFNIKENRAFKILEIPLCVMDVSLFSSKAMNLNYRQAKKKMFDLIDKAKKHNTHISILWHNYSFDFIDYPFWGKLYWDIIKYAKRKNVQT